MLFAALILSGLLLLGVHIAVRNNKTIGALLCCGAIAFAAFGLLMMVLPVVLWHALFLSVAVIYWKAGRWQPKRFITLSLTATALAYVIAGVGVARKYQQHDDWRQRFAYESLDDRIPWLATNSETHPKFNEGQLGELESECEQSNNWYSRSPRLEKLHEKAVDQFVNSWGFGVGRVIRIEPSEESLTDGLRTDPAPLQPSNPSYGLPSSTKDEPLNRGYDTLHDNAVLDFLHPKGFGFVKDRQHVAGFQSHRFSQIPGPVNVWDDNRSINQSEVEVVRLELVSLLMHKEPGVYLSDRLPQMDALKGVPTRPLDAFETEGLAALRKSEDLFVREDRMLGAIRNVKQCIACHGGERGQLLGAFTYTLRSTK